MSVLNPSISVAACPLKQGAKPISTRQGANPIRLRQGPEQVTQQVHEEPSGGPHVSLQGPVTREIFHYAALFPFF